MNKLFIDARGAIIGLYKPANNEYTIIDNFSRPSIESVFYADEPGQVFTDTEVVDYNKDDIVLVVSKYDRETTKWNYKVIVVTDMMAKDDIKEWFFKNETC